MPLVFIADWVGDAVPACASGRVHSVFRRACNIETDGGELLTVLSGELGNLPHAIRLAGGFDPMASGLQRDQFTVLDEARLSVPSAGLSLDFSGAAVWCGKIPAMSLSAAAAPGSAESARALNSLIARLRGFSAGIAPLLFTRPGGRSLFERAFAGHLAKILPDMANATARLDAGGVMRAAARLIGMGEGLTPSGDDFLAGYLAALRSRAQVEWEIDMLLRELERPLGALVRRTHAISRQMLNDALRGRFAQNLVDVVDAIAGTGRLTCATTRALDCGHSSGADTLCGLLFGYSPELVLQELPSRPRLAAEYIRIGATGVAVALA